MAKRISDENAMQLAGKAILAAIAKYWDELPTKELLLGQIEVVSKAAKELGYADPLTEQDFAEIGTWANLATIDLEVRFDD